MREINLDREKRIQEEVEKTLSAMDSLPRLEANPFLYTRIRAELDSGNLSESKSPSCYLKPAALVLIVIINIVTLFYYIESGKKEASRDQLIYSLTSDYNSSQNEF